MNTSLLIDKDIVGRLSLVRLKLSESNPVAYTSIPDVSCIVNSRRGVLLTLVCQPLHWRATEVHQAR